MPSDEPASQRVAPARKGLMHAVDATRYSLAGARRLWEETATRLELGAGVLAAPAFLWRGAEVWQWLLALALLALVLAFEALNTAIEVLTDRISPEWSAMARDAKDLGSLAVGLTQAIAGGFVLAVLAGVL